MKLACLLSVITICVAVSFSLGKPNSQQKPRDIYREAFAPLSKTTDHKRASSELQAEIDKLESMKLPSQIKPKPVPESEQKAKDPEPGTDAGQYSEPKSALTEKILNQLRSSVPSDVTDALGLADALYAANYHQHAYNIYKVELGKTKHKDTQAWILFQMGNSKDPSDMKQALVHYSELIKKHPKSIWAKPAARKIRLINWFINNKPADFLKELSAFSRPENFKSDLDK